MTEMLTAIKQSGPPTKYTPGAVGQDYVDTDTGLRWECVEATNEKSYKHNRVVYNWVLRGLDPEFVVDGLADEEDKPALPVKLDILETIVDYENLSGSNRKFTFPSEITLTDGDLYLLIYKYFYNGFGSLDNHITAVSKVIDGKVYWGHSDPDNSVMMDKTGVTDNWLATDDDTTESNFKIYKVQKSITDEAAYHVMQLEGYDCIAPGIHAHAEGVNTVASGMYSHAEGTNTEAAGAHSHAEGFNTKAASGGQHVEGKYNEIDEYGKYAHIVGNGTDESNRSNAYTLDWEGNAHFAGDIYFQGCSLTDFLDHTAEKPSAQYVKLSALDWVKDGDVYIQIGKYGNLSEEVMVSVRPLPGYENEYFNARITPYYVKEENGGCKIRYVAKTLPTSDIKVCQIYQLFDIALETPPFGFTSSSPFTISVDKKGWNGIIEYWVDNVETGDATWAIWSENTISAQQIGANEYRILLRGIGNTCISSSSVNRWTITGSNVRCIGNIETLLDWETVAIEEHPTMGDNCYSDMFFGCTALTTAPELPATTLAKYCYTDMFYGCTALTTAPTLPATTLAERCCSQMFYGCTALTTAPALPATTLAEYCYNGMFYGCTALTTAPALPATTLAKYCYQSMFHGCTALTTAPALPATTLTDNCYAYMFNKCAGIKLSSSETDSYTRAYRVPTAGTGVTAFYALQKMFDNTGGTFTGTPSINTTYYLHKDCSIVS